MVLTKRTILVQNLYYKKDIESLPILKVTFNIGDRFGYKREYSHDFIVDTGYSGGLKMPEEFALNLEELQVPVVSINIKLANGEICRAKYTDVEVTALQGQATYIFPKPISTTLSCFGKEIYLMGRDMLKTLISEFDGPKELLSILSEIS